MSRAVFTIDSDQPFVEIELVETVDKLQKVERKRVDYKEFRKIILSSEDEKNYISIGRIPNGLYDAAINEYGFKCLVLVKGGRKPLIYYDTHYLIPFPDLMFSFWVKKGVVIESSVYSLIGEVNDNASLFHYPFGNVRDGRICWGSNVLNKIWKLRDVEIVISTFFGTPTNDDLWDSGRYIKVSDGDPRRYQRAFIESLQQLEKFPDSILLKTDLCVKDLIKKW